MILLTRIASLEPKSSASANSAIPAYCVILLRRGHCCQLALLTSFAWNCIISMRFGGPTRYCLLALPRDEVHLFLWEPGYEHRAHDAADVLIRFALSLDDLRHALADASVEVHASIAFPLGKGLQLELKCRLIRRRSPRQKSSEGT